MLSLTRSTGRIMGLILIQNIIAHLDFADDIIMMAHTPQELEKMLNDIHTTSKPVRTKPAPRADKRSCSTTSLLQLTS